MRRVLNLKSTDILDYFCTLFGALTPKTKNSDGGVAIPLKSFNLALFAVAYSRAIQNEILLILSIL